MACILNVNYPIDPVYFFTSSRKVDCQHSSLVRASTQEKLGVSNSHQVTRLSNKEKV